MLKVSYFEYIMKIRKVTNNKETIENRWLCIHCQASGNERMNTNEYKFMFVHFMF